MCGRFFIDAAAPDELAALIDHAERKAQRRTPGLYLPRGEVRPGDYAAVIALDRSLRRSAFAMQWGFRMNKRLLINARSETAAEKPAFRQSMQERRCLIPVSAYFEWDHRVKPLDKYTFQVDGNRVIYLAGLYRYEPDVPQPVFTILTREAAPDIACFHDRMPVILPPELTDAWLDRTQDPQALLSRATIQLAWQRCDP